MVASSAKRAELLVLAVKGMMMTKKIDTIKPEANLNQQERVKELLSDPVVKAHCELLEKQGVAYKIIPMYPKRLSA